MTKKRGRPKKYRSELKFARNREAKQREDETKKQRIVVERPVQRIAQQPTLFTPLTQPIGDKLVVSPEENSCKMHAMRELKMLSAKPRDFFDNKSGGTGNDSNLVGNRLLPLESLLLLIEEHLTCKKCHERDLDEFAAYVEENMDSTWSVMKLLEKYRKKRSTKIKMSEHTVGIATKINCNCTHCDLLFETSRSRTKFPNNKYEYNSTESYSMNVMLVLGMQQIGGGGSDAMKLLTFLGLPNGQSFKDRGFKRVEDKIGVEIQKMGKDIEKQCIKRGGGTYASWKTRMKGIQANIKKLLFQYGQQGDKGGQADRAINNLSLVS